MISKISIGSAQFGLDYGINNDKGKISSQEVALILERAHELGLRNIDTAVAYGDSHKVLGECNLSNWNITTKISKIRSEFNIPDTIYSEVSRSLDILNIESISAVLVHDANQLIDIDIGSKIFEGLELLKSRGLTEKVGISIYEASSLDLLKDKIKDIDIVQAPLSIIDRRLFFSGWIDKLKKSNVEVQIRSIFLQGLLLMDYNEQIRKFSKWKELWNMWKEWQLKSEISPIQACINYVNSIKDIDNIIVGIDSLDQLMQIIYLFKNSDSDFPEKFYSSDINLINPYLWN